MNLSDKYATQVDMENLSNHGKVSEPIIMHLTKPNINLIDLSYNKPNNQASTSIASFSNTQHTKTQSHISQETDEYGNHTLNISVPKLQLSCLNTTTGIQANSNKKKRRTKKERSVNYPEGSTFNTKTLHLKPKKTMRFDEFQLSLRPSTQSLHPTTSFQTSPIKKGEK